ncbi:hypothetical protein GCM10023205_73770 [Yinghuangia aomiensis]|uniref:Uncharacterized protein n=1 Tax=Yinghuangia aomiensis TaxID=676205 RepID=A0ABP9I885_9ACTN
MRTIHAPRAKISDGSTTGDARQRSPRIRRAPEIQLAVFRRPEDGAAFLCIWYAAFMSACLCSERCIALAFQIPDR